MSDESTKLKGPKLAKFVHSNEMKVAPSCSSLTQFKKKKKLSLH